MHYTLNIKSSFVNCLVVGGGEIALRKIKGLIDSEIHPTVISPRLNETLTELVEKHNLVWHSREFEQGDTHGFNLVFATTDNTLVNSQISQEAAERKVLCDDVSDSSNCSFHTPAVIKRGDLQLTISTSGKIPFLTHRLKQHFEQQIPMDINTQIAVLEKCRESIILRAQGDAELKQKLIEKELEPLVRNFLDLF